MLCDTNGVPGNPKGEELRLSKNFRPKSTASIVTRVLRRRGRWRWGERAHRDMCADRTGNTTYSRPSTRSCIYRCYRLCQDPYRTDAHLITHVRNSCVIQIHHPAHFWLGSADLYIKSVSAPKGRALEI